MAFDKSSPTYYLDTWMQDNPRQPGEAAVDYNNRAQSGALDLANADLSNAPKADPGKDPNVINLQYVQGTRAFTGGKAKAVPRLATTAPTTALRTYGAFLGGTGLGSTDPLLGSDSSGTARGRLLG